jgi:hypothetical protein
MASEDAARRVLFVDNQVNDFLLHRMVLARSLREFGFDIHVAVPQEPGLEEISRQGFQVHTFFLRRFSTQPLDELRCLASLISLYRWLRPTLVHHIGLKTSLYGGLATRITRVPAAVDTLTGLGHLFTARSIQKLVLRSVAVGGLRVSFSHKNHRVILQHLNDLDCLLAWGIDCATAVLIKGSGVNVSLFKPCPEPEGTPVVLMASRLLWEKVLVNLLPLREPYACTGCAPAFGLPASRIMATRPPFRPLYSSVGIMLVTSNGWAGAMTCLP